MTTQWNNLTKSQQNERDSWQRVLEEDMLMTSCSRYWKDYGRAPDEGIPEQQLLDAVVDTLSPCYQEWIDKVCANPKTPQWVHPLVAVGARKMADLTIRCLLKVWLTPNIFGYKFAEQHSPPTAQILSNLISQEVINIVGFQNAKEEYKEDWRMQSKFIKNWTPKRCIAFAKKMDAIPKMTLKQRQDFGHHMIRIAEESNVIVSQRHRRKTKRGYRNYLYIELAPEILKDLHEQHYLLEMSTLLYRPMVVPPIDHTLSASGGHLTPHIRKPVVQKYRSNLYEDEKLEQKSSEPSQLVLDGVNALQKTEWTINDRVHEVMKNLFENNTGIANLPCCNFEEFMFNDEYPTDGTKQEQAVWCQHREETWGNWYKEEQARGRMFVRLKLIERIKRWGFFYMPYTLDFRGRAYSVCELLSPQSSDIDRGLIMFANSMEQTEEGLYWQKIYLANLFGMDKLPFDDRIEWVDKHWDIFESINNDPYSEHFWVDSAVKKNKSFQRLAVIFDMFRTDGLTQVPVHVDGKCNGSQHWAALMRDEIIGTLTNVLPSDEPQDLYQYVADKTTEYCKFHLDENEYYEQFMDHWDDGIDRSVTKRSTMCDSYGLTFYGIQKYTRTEGHVDWIPKEKRGGAVVELARAIQAGLNTSLESPNTGKAYLKELASIACDNNKQLTWWTPSGFKVVHVYNKTGSRRSLAKLFNNKELQFFFRTKDVDERAVKQAISPNYIHSLDAAHMFLTIFAFILDGFKDMSMIHDSFGCHAPLIGKLNKHIREEFCKMHSKNLLENFRADIKTLTGTELPEVPETGDLDINDVLISLFFFS
tara:strand:- start:1144 stop:3588 length:2445 start_codon:yes stop_codon:yes gene_type:complete